jgi:hypothetical protein
MKKLFAVLPCLLVLAAGCSDNASAPQAGQEAGARAELASIPKAMAPESPAMAARAGGVASTADPPAGPVAVPTERKIIRNGELDMEVPDVDAALKAVRSEIEKAGGYLSDETQSRGDDGAKRAAVTVRLPAGTFDGSLEALQRLGTVQRVNISGEDITEQYYDLEIQLRNRQQLETRLLALLDRPSNKLTELLEIEREVARVRNEIDSLEGRKRFWDSQVSFSRLQVTLHEPVPITRGGMWATLRGAFRSAGENFVNAVAGLIALTGGLLPVIVLLWVLWVVWRALRRRRRDAKATAKP